MSTDISIYNLAQYFDKKLDELPEDLCKAVEQKPILMNWDSLSLAERIILVQQDEIQHEKTFSETISFNLYSLKEWIYDEINRANKTNNDVRRMALTDIEKKLREHVFLENSENPANQANFNNRERDNLLRIIGALLETILDRSTDEKGELLFSSQSKLIENLTTVYKSIDGISKSNLENKFSEARNIINSN